MKQRILTAIVFGAILLPIVIYGGLPIVLLAYALGSIALYELLKMRNLHLLTVHGVLSLFLLWVFLLPSAQEGILTELGVTKMEVALLVMLVFLAYTVVTKNSFTFDDAGFSILAALYIGVGFHYFIETRAAENGLVFLFYSLLLIWATDSGAYFIGKAMGKRKLWPEISPNKTIEGSLGGVICALVVGVLFSLFTDIPATFIQLAIVTAVLSIFGQIGDLAESAFKRHYGVKDSGTILPGHGGILDRFDSLLFVWPLLHFLSLIP